ncbi:uncharacterized protein LOC130724708 [Lotus japonicus]|uniref:uncharacterized protein LOC130724708 n=1 Tax=Lotus japonicus TaxID=34305 RepID=UPI00258E6E02|nr:uncharacterized protein LOC130724708 [Lotus japonicus]
MIFLYLLFLRLISSLVFQRIYSILSHPIICHIFYFSILPSLREWCQSIFIILHEARDFLAKHGVKLDCCDLLFQETPLVVPPPLLSDTKIKRPEFNPRLRQIRDVQTFSHGEIKVIELGDCVGNFYEIEIAMNALKYFHKLERIILSPSKCWKHDRTWPQNGRERILAKLQSEGIGLDKLVLI